MIFEKFKSHDLAIISEYKLFLRLSRMFRDNKIDHVVDKDTCRIIVTDYKNHFKFIFEITEQYNAEIDSTLMEEFKNIKKNEMFYVNTLESVKILKKDDNYLKDVEFNFFCNEIDKRLAIKLKDYQYKSAFFLSKLKSGFDFSVPGSGKTIISYAAYSQNKAVNKLLIIGPKNAYTAWEEEFYTCFREKPNFKNLANENIKNAKRYFNQLEEDISEIVFININKCHACKNEIKKFLKNNNVMLIIDEAHKVKNIKSNATLSTMYISKHTEYKILLTGTPMPNGYEDLFSLCKIIQPNQDIIRFSQADLKNMNFLGNDDPKIDKLKDDLNPFFTRISKNYLIKNSLLTPPKHKIVISNMNNHQQEIYDELNSQYNLLKDKIDYNLLNSLKKAILIRKMQISANPLLLRGVINKSFMETYFFEKDSQIDTFLDIDEISKCDNILMEELKKSKISKLIEGYSSGKLLVNKNNDCVALTIELLKKSDKIIIWDTFVKNMEIIHYKLTKLGISSTVINGKIIGEKRDDALEEFRDGDIKVLIASAATLAESISLHRTCQTAIYLNKNYNAAQHIQSKDRIHRINMPEDTEAKYFHFLNKNSIDIIIHDRLLEKEKKMLEILDHEELSVGNIEWLEEGMSKKIIEEDFLK